MNINITTGVCSVEKPVVLMLSLDGFRAEYLTRGLTPTLRALSECGVRAEFVRPVFPTETFPNHVTIATVTHPSLLTL